MIRLGQQDRRERLTSAVIVAALHALLGYAFITGLGINVPQKVSEQFKLFDVRADPPPPPRREKPRPARAKAPKREGAASPANRKSQATPVVAPPPEVRLPPVPPPLIASPTPRLGYDPTAGAAPVPGPGTGSGGRGNGSGSGDYGNGSGGGGEGGTPLRWLSGRLKNSDYPRGALQAGVSGTVGLRFIVGVKGRVTDCMVTRSSGSAELDAETCRLIVQRFRYKPRRDAGGQPIPTVVNGEHEWYLIQHKDRWVDPEPEDDER